jgi:DNA-binding CsgD family transcriptional regulator
MDYMTASEAAKKWSISGRAITYHLKAGRIPGAVKKEKLWLIPANAERPADKRKGNQTLPKSTPLDLLADLSYVSSSSTKPMPIHNPDAILESIEEERIRLIYEMELSYLRGDFEKVIHCFDKTLGDDGARLRACPAAIAASISMGDYQTYTKIDAYLKRCITDHPDPTIRATAEFSYATVAVSASALNMVPDWLKKGDFSVLTLDARPNALNLWAKYFYYTGAFDTMLAVAKSALTLTTPESGITLTNIYLRISCAIACYALEREEEAKNWLLSAMRLALPHGFVTPFAEFVALLGGLTEQCMEEEFPDAYHLVMEQWERTWKNWLIFHNQFTKDNITLILSLREYHIALLVARGVSYTKIAKHYGISVGRLKNIILEIYEKLIISGRDELEKYVF